MINTRATCRPKSRCQSDLSTVGVLANKNLHQDLMHSGSRGTAETNVCLQAFSLNYKTKLNYHRSRRNWSLSQIFLNRFILAALTCFLSCKVGDKVAYLVAHIYILCSNFVGLFDAGGQSHNTDHAHAWYLLYGCEPGFTKSPAREIAVSQWYGHPHSQIPSLLGIPGLGCPKRWSLRLCLNYFRLGKSRDCQSRIYGWIV